MSFLWRRVGYARRARGGGGCGGGSAAATRTFETVTKGQLTMMLSSSWHAALTMLTGCDAHPPTGCCAAPHSA